MAEVLTQSGIAAVVKDVDKFVRDVGKMDRATKKLTDTQSKLSDMQDRMAMKASLLQQKYDEQAAATEQLQDNLQKLGIALVAAGAAATAFIGSATQLAGRVETLGVVVDTLGTQVGRTPAAMRDLEKELQGTGITLSKSREAIARMIQSEIDLANATDLAREAQNAAVIANVDSSEAFNRLVYVIQSGNVRMARTLGLQVSFEQAYARTAAALGKTTDELTMQEKVQARTQEVLKAGTTIAGAYEAAMTTAGKKVLSLNRHWEESRRILGEAYLPEYTKLVDLVTNSLKWWQDLTIAQQGLISGLLGGGAAVALLTGALILAIPKIIAAAGALKALALAAVANPLILVAAAIAAVGVAAFAAKKRQEAIDRTFEDVAKNALSAGKSYEQYRKEAEELAEEQGLVEKQTRKLVTSTGYWTSGMEDVQREVELVTGDVEYMTERTYDNALAAQAADRAMLQWASRMHAANDPIQQIIRNQERAAEAQREWAEQVYTTTKASQELWDNLTPDLAGIISGWIELINFVQVGGPQLQQALESIWMGVTTGALGTQQAEQMLQGAMGGAVVAEVAAELGTDTGYQFTQGVNKGLREAGFTYTEISDFWKDYGDSSAAGFVEGMAASLTEQEGAIYDANSRLAQKLATDFTDPAILKAAGAAEGQDDFFAFLGIQDPNQADLSGLQGKMNSALVGPASAAEGILNRIASTEYETDLLVNVEYSEPPPMQHGGSFTVGGRAGIDQNLVMFRATRGERVTVTPAGASGSTVYNQQRSVNVGDVHQYGGINDDVFDNHMRRWLGA
jgi:hypothetical protein